MSDKPLVSIVIVNYNGLDVLPECLASLRRQTHDRREVIVVDNASTDGSRDRVRGNHPEVELIANETNVGYAAACNQGWLASCGAYVAFLNSDTVADSCWLEKSLAVMATDPAIAACMPKLLIHGSGRINSSGGVQHYLGVAWAGDCNEPDRVPEMTRDVAFASGAAMVVRADALRRVGPFDPDFYMYCEDTDLSWRLRLAGYRVVMAPDAVVWHRYDFSRNAQKFYLIERNRLAMLATNYKLSTLFVILPAFVLLEMGMLTYALIYGWLGGKLRGYRDLAADRRRLLEKRRRVQGARTVSDREITALFASEIDFFAVNNALVRIANPFFKLYWKAAYRLIN